MHCWKEGMKWEIIHIVNPKFDLISSILKCHGNLKYPLQIIYEAFLSSEQITNLRWNWRKRVSLRVPVLQYLLLVLPFYLFFYWNIFFFSDTGIEWEERAGQINFHWIWSGWRQSATTVYCASRCLVWCISNKGLQHFSR